MYLYNKVEEFERNQQKEEIFNRGFKCKPVSFYENLIDLKIG